MSHLDFAEHIIIKWFEEPCTAVLFQDSTDPLESRFLLSDHLFAKAKIPPTDKVCLWLGVSS